MFLTLDIEFLNIHKAFIERIMNHRNVWSQPNHVKLDQKVYRRRSRMWSTQKEVGLTLAMD